MSTKEITEKKLSNNGNNELGVVEYRVYLKTVNSVSPHDVPEKANMISEKEAVDIATTLKRHYPIFNFVVAKFARGNSYPVSVEYDTADMDEPSYQY